MAKAKAAAVKRAKLEINTEYLTGWFKDNYTTIGFLNFKLKSGNPPEEIDPPQLIELKKLIDDDLDVEIPLFKQKETILKIWKNLIGIAIVYLKYNDRREIFHDDEDYGVVKLAHFFEAFSEFESLFYGADKYYRDHVSHMFQVFLLGEFLLKEKKMWDLIEVGDKKFITENRISNKEKEAMWCIISLCHDLGYGMGMIPKINAKTRNMLENFGSVNIQDISYSFPNQPLYDFIIQFISSDLKGLDPISEETIDIDGEEKAVEKDENRYVNHIQSKYFLKFSGSFERYGHGIISCILLMRNLVYFLESDYSIDSNKAYTQKHAKHFLIRQNILRSIASHDCDDIYYLNIVQFPFLLTIFDEMQDWDRPGLTDLFTEKPDLNLIVHELSDSKVDFEIEISKKTKHKLSGKERAALEFDIISYFERKCKKIRKILRSAVGGDSRNIWLKFSVTVRYESDIHEFKIIHVNPEDVTICFENEKHTWTEFLNYKDTKEKALKS
jgi:hypothetical protein